MIFSALVDYCTSLEIRSFKSEDILSLSNKIFGQAFGQTGEPEPKQADQRFSHSPPSSFPPTRQLPSSNFKSSKYWTRVRETPLPSLSFFPPADSTAKKKTASKTVLTVTITIEPIFVSCVVLSLLERWWWTFGERKKTWNSGKWNQLKMWKSETQTLETQRETNRGNRLQRVATTTSAEQIKEKKPKKLKLKSRTDSNNNNNNNNINSNGIINRGASYSIFLGSFFVDFAAEMWRRQQRRRQRQRRRRRRRRRRRQQGIDAWRMSEEHQRTPDRKRSQSGPWASPTDGLQRLKRSWFVVWRRKAHFVF